MAKDIGAQVKDILTDSAAKLEVLKGRGMAMAEKVMARADDFREMATKSAHDGQVKLNGLLTDMSPKDFLDKFGGLKFPELVEKLKSSELAHQAEAIRLEVLSFLRLPSNESVEKIEVQMDKLAREVAGLKGLKSEVKRLADDLKTLKKPVARAEKSA